MVCRPLFLPSVRALLSRPACHLANLPSESTVWTGDDGAQDQRVTGESGASCQPAFGTFDATRTRPALPLLAIDKQPGSRGMWWRPGERRDEEPDMRWHLRTSNGRP